MSLRISSIEEIEMVFKKEFYTLLIVDCDNEAIDFCLALNIGLEYLPVTIDGED